MIAIERLKMTVQTLIKTEGKDATIKLETLLKVIDQEIETDKLYH